MRRLARWTWNNWECLANYANLASHYWGNGPGRSYSRVPAEAAKTTPIYACLRHLVRTSRGGRHCVTIEDPVEQVIEGLSQAQARPGQEFDFARGLRGLLRQDPEVIMIGEIRDAETAKVAIEAALTGHL